jgi:hypothetical protein
LDASSSATIIHIQSQSASTRHGGIPLLWFR